MELEERGRGGEWNQELKGVGWWVGLRGGGARGFGMGSGAGRCAGIGRGGGAGAGDLEGVGLETNL